ncbi:accessory gene regulator B family protein [uncultured Vagococcus sp.]|uniref:accessory gene regulator B family protein n=1 Tax=uncultured Vagococcus sp. TaxID=189676 RepID=UPI0028D1DABC|nr:accessory gene regulator B family protein [uncultured Vagococcus sp.]
MISKLSNKIVTNWTKGSVIKKEHVSAYHYGCELFISDMISNIIVLSAAAMMGKVIEMLLFLVVFTYIRVACGGYHATSYKNCILIFTSSTIAFFLGINWLMAEDLHQLLIVFAGISVLIIFILAPVDHVNKPLTEEEKVAFRQKTIKRLFLIVLALGVSYLIFPILLDILVYGCLAIIVIALFLVIGLIERNSSLRLSKQL